MNDLPAKKHPLEEDFAAARELGRQMAKEDTWIEPVFDNIKKYKDDYGEFQEIHRANWEETDQFEIRWLPKLIALSEASGKRDYVSPMTDNMTWYFEYHTPLKSAFWDAWEEEVGLLQKWQAAKDSLTRGES